MLETIQEVFSYNLRKLRGDRTQAEIAALAGIPFPSYRRCEYGNIPQADNLAAIARALGVKETALFLDPDLAVHPSIPTPSAALAVLTDAVARLAALDDKQARRHDDIDPDALAPLPEDDNDLLGDPEESNHKAPKPRRS